MKKLLLLGAIALSSLSFSQDDADWFIRSDATVGAAFTANAKKSYGISAGVEPKFFFNENIAVGLRFEGGVLFGGKLDLEGESEAIEVQESARVAYLLKGEYYLGSGNTKPFVGLMTGWYTQANIGVGTSGSNASVSMSVGRSWGLGTELGVTFGNFRLSGIYHFVPQKDILSIQTGVGSTEQVEVGYSYWVVHLGFRAWGYNDK